MASRPERPLARAATVILALGAVMMLGLAAPAGAHVTADFQHLWQEHILPKIQSAGTINANGNPVHWTKLKGVPGTFADGVDYPLVLGPGLHKSAFELGLSLDTTVVQSRVGGTCPPGSAIRAISREGAVTCGAGPAVFGGFRNDTGIICNDRCTEGLLPLPPGVYAVNAKIVLIQGDSSVDQISAACFLHDAVGVSDAALYQVEDRDDIVNPEATLAMQIVTTITEENPAVSVDCSDLGVGDVRGEHLKITAVRAGTASVVPLQHFDN